jgi:hypothetical protein
LAEAARESISALDVQNFMRFTYSASRT